MELTRRHAFQSSMILEGLNISKKCYEMAYSLIFSAIFPQISSEAERRKASDFRVQRDLYELRLTQLTKSAKSEIQRLVSRSRSKKELECLEPELLRSATYRGGLCWCLLFLIHCGFRGQSWINYEWTAASVWTGVWIFDESWWDTISHEDHVCTFGVLLNSCLVLLNDS